MSAQLLARLPDLLDGGDVQLTRFGEASDVASLFVVLTAEVWTHIPGGEPVDVEDLRARMLGRIAKTPSCVTWLIYLDGALVGTTSHFGQPDGSEALEIGATYMAPSTWATGLNARVKELMIAAARESGAKRVLFRTDERNVRSAHAILKLGARAVGTRREEIIRADGSQRPSLLFELDIGSSDAVRAPRPHPRALHLPQAAELRHPPGPEERRP
ncbi:GNAT family N-acetyltransferase [Microbacterium gorillae]|uniref:GNAT family N-acetyltransferase n=1 Tax=Microbacterium gorillae TaxID=1231063 RepID=UPI000B9BAD38|nr:GNAT family protein [Microbacterium gorillae]